jgi:integrase
VGVENLCHLCRRVLWTSAVPAAAGWRGGTLPRGVEAGQVSRLLRSCDRRTVMGRRDYAILMLLSRRGPRVGEVAALTLDDIDWRHGEIVIRGKGGRRERLPLPADAGQALAGNLSCGRPALASRFLFLRGARAPALRCRSRAVSEGHPGSPAIPARHAPKVRQSP